MINNAHVKASLNKLRKQTLGSSKFLLSLLFPDLFTSAHKDCPLPQGTDPLSPDLPSSRPPTIAPDHVTGKVTGHASSSPLLLPIPRSWAVSHSSPQGAETIPVSPHPCLTWLLLVASQTLRFWYSAEWRSEFRLGIQRLNQDCLEKRVPP